jgi:hypothetical protein
VRGFYTALWRSPRHAAEEGEDASARRSRARCRAVLHAEGEDEDDPPLVDISTKGYGLLLGWCLGRGAGLLDGLHGQVSLVGFLSFSF